MDATTARVIVIANTVGEPPEIYHRDFPEIRFQDETVRQAAVGLVRSLERALDSALTVWRQDSLQAAVRDVQTFLDDLSRDATAPPAPVPTNR